MRRRLIARVTCLSALIAALPGCLGELRLGDVRLRDVRLGEMLAGVVNEPAPVRIDVRVLGHCGVRPSRLPAWYGRTVDAVAETILAVWWKTPVTSRGTGIVCREPMLSERQARLLAGNRFAVFLPRLKELRPDAARQLRSCTGILDFDALESLSAPAAVALAGSREALLLNALRELDAATARGLAASVGSLKLDGLTRLEPGVAAALAEHRGMLSLNGIVELSVEDAAHLAAHRGDLCLNGLRRLPADVAHPFARFPHALHINSVETLSESAAAALARHPGWCLGCSGLMSLDDAAVAAISRHTRSGRAIAAALRVPCVQSR